MDPKGDTRLANGGQRQPQAVPTAKYSKLSEKLRQVTNSDLQCSIFCGGKKCKYESANWDDKDMAISGLYSHWVTDDILAMARPNDAAIDKFNIVEQFQRLNIKSIINLQTRGEHSNCGNVLHESGFSYNPQTFMKNNVFFYNFSIKDYGVASRDFLLDMVKVMAFALLEGKVAIHCHAGLGRTGVLIACYLIYSLRVNANEAIRYVRFKRPKSIQTRGQILCVQEFAKYISPSFVIFSRNNPNKEDELTFSQCLQRQSKILHGYEARDLKFIPKLVFIICQRLLHICHCIEEPILVNGEDQHDRATTPFWKAYISSTVISPLKTRSFSDVTASKKLVHKLERKTSTSTLVEWSMCSIPSRSVSILESPTPYISASLPSLAALTAEDLRDAMPLAYSSWDEEAEELGPPGVADVGKLEDSLSLFSLSSMDEEPNVATVKDVTGNACYQALVTKTELGKQWPTEKPTALRSANEIATLFLAWKGLEDFTSEFRDKVHKYQKDLNEHSATWEMLAHENDPVMLVSLMCTWFEDLKEPAYGKNELEALKSLQEDNVTSVLANIPNGQRFTTEYLVRFVCQFNPLSDECRNVLFDRISDLLCGNQGNVLLGRFFKKLAELLYRVHSPISR